MDTSKTVNERIVRDKISERRANFALMTSKYILIATLACGGVALVAWAFLPRYVIFPIILGVVAMVALGAWLCPLFHRNDQPTVGSAILIGALFLLNTTWPVFLPDLLLGVAVMFILVAIMGVLLLGSLGGTVTLSAAVIAFIGDIIIANTWTPPWYGDLPTETIFIISMALSLVAFVVTMVITYVMMLEQENNFSAAQLATLEIEQRAQQEQERRAYLQATVQRYADFMTQVGQGDLATRLSLEEDTATADDSLVMLGHSLNTMTANLQEMIAQIRAAANNLSTAAAEILAATTQQAAGANEQSTAITQTTTTVDQVSNISEQAVEQAKAVTEASQRTVEVSRTGEQTMADALAGMEQIKKQVESIAENILNLSGRTQQIGSIIATVNDIAAQSKVLALNASVEAARAGEHGRGFSVVAVEVRNLAEQSRQATAQVRGILSEIQGGINSTVMATEEGTKVVEQGQELLQQSREVLTQLAQVIKEAAQYATQVMSGGRQQATGIEQIALAMQNINQATTQNMAGTRQAEKAAQNLNELANNLLENVEQYKV